MCIPKTNNSFAGLVKENGQKMLPIVAFFSQLAAGMRILIGGALLLATLTLPLHSNAAQLNASVFAGTESVSFMTARNNMPTLPAGTPRDGRLSFDSDLLEADIADFAAQRTQQNTGKKTRPRFSEFSSVSVGTLTLTDAPLHASDNRSNPQFRGAGSAAAGMMVVVWLFCIGLIGIGTVGRRKQTKP